MHSPSDQLFAKCGRPFRSPLALKCQNIVDRAACIGDVIVIPLSTVEYTSVSRVYNVYSTVDSGITNLIQDRL